MPIVWLESAEAFSYPGGERQVRVGEWVQKETERESAATVVARIRSSQDIVDLALLRDALGFNTNCKLVLPYLPYSRADRRFVPGDCEGLLVFARLLFSMSWDRIVTLDVHSKAAHDCISSLTELPATNYISRAIEDFACRTGASRIAVLLPDAGASNRYHIPELLGCNIHQVEVAKLHCSKQRDAGSGKLLAFEVPPLPPNDPVVIVDDICDGGGTFLGIANHIPEGQPLALYTTHSIYSKGLDPLKRFTLYTTNSYKQDYDDDVVVFDCIGDLLKA